VVLRKRRVIEFAAESLGRQESGTLAACDEEPVSLWLGRGYVANDQRHGRPTEEKIRQILARTNKFFPEDELNCGACGYATCRDKAVAVANGMAEEAMCLPFMIDQAERVCHELRVPWKDLREVHRHLINTEKLASMGQMAAGVAHELNNPLSSILLYSHILRRKLAHPRLFYNSVCFGSLQVPAYLSQVLHGKVRGFVRTHDVMFPLLFHKPPLPLSAPRSHLPPALV